DLLDEVLEEAVHFNGGLLRGGDARFLKGDLARYVYRLGVVGEDLALDSVFERGDDGPAVGVILRVGGKHKLNVERQAKFESADLDVFFLQHVEQGDLYARLQIGQFVDHEDAAMCTRDEPKVDDTLVVVSELERGGLDGVYVAH